MQQEMEYWVDRTRSAMTTTLARGGTVYPTAALFVLGEHRGQMFLMKDTRQENCMVASLAAGLCHATEVIYSELEGSAFITKVLFNDGRTETITQDYTLTDGTVTWSDAIIDVGYFTHEPPPEMDLPDDATIMDLIQQAVQITDEWGDTPEKIIGGVLDEQRQRYYLEGVDAPEWSRKMAFVHMMSDDEVFMMWHPSLKEEFDRFTPEGYKPITVEELIQRRDEEEG